MTKIKLTIIISVLYVLFNSIHMESTSHFAAAQSLSSLDVNSEDKQKVRCSERKVDASKIEEVRLKKLTQLARYFGIETEGKTIEQLKSEIEKAKQANPEKWHMLKKELHDKKIKMLEQKSKHSLN